jgi:hypothetical protein
MRTAQLASFSITQPFLAPSRSGIPASKIFTLQKDLELFVKNRNGFFMSASRGHRTVQNIGILESSHHSPHQQLVIVGTLTLASLLQYIIYSWFILRHRLFGLKPLKETDHLEYLATDGKDNIKVDVRKIG